MSKDREIEIIINNDGTVTVDQIGWEGKDCHGAIDDLIKQIGNKMKSTKKDAYYKGQRVKIDQQTGF